MKTTKKTKIIVPPPLGKVENFPDTIQKVLKYTTKVRRVRQIEISAKANISQGCISKFLTGALWQAFDRAAKLIQACGYDLYLKPGKGVTHCYVASEKPRRKQSFKHRKRA